MRDKHGKIIDPNKPNKKALLKMRNEQRLQQWGKGVVQMEQEHDRREHVGRTRRLT